MGIRYDEAILNEVEALKRKAVDKTGLSDFGAPYFEAPPSLHGSMT